MEIVIAIFLGMWFVLAGVFAMVFVKRDLQKYLAQNNKSTMSGEIENE